MVTEWTNFVAIVLVIFLEFFIYKNSHRNFKYEKARVSTNTIEDKKENIGKKLDDKENESAVLKEIVNISNIKKDEYTKKEIFMKATLSDFSFNKDSGIKFMKIKDSSGEVKAVAFKNTELPYLAIGTTYTFVGKVDKYEGEFEIIVSEVK